MPGMFDEEKFWKDLNDEMPANEKLLQMAVESDQAVKTFYYSGRGSGKTAMQALHKQKYKWCILTKNGFEIYNDVPDALIAFWQAWKVTQHNFHDVSIAYIGPNPHYKEPE